MYPRLMIAGTSGDCGKTLVAVGLAAAWRQEGLSVAPFKKGPDYIDTAWLSLAANRPARNLDSWMMGTERVLRSFVANAAGDGINLVEANRGLYDGENPRGTHSSAELAKLLGLPVVLVLPATKMTRTAAAITLGMKLLDSSLKIAGVLLNRVANGRQETIMRDAIEGETGLPVLGAIPRINPDPLPGRHLGLVTPQDHCRAEQAVNAAASLVRRSIDLKRLQTVAEMAGINPLPDSGMPAPACGSCDGARELRIGYFAGPAFTFYYPENMEAIDRTGATRVPVDPIKDSGLPPLDALYVGGGFPEVHSARLADNASFRASIAIAARNGLPVWAECGGLMFLSRSIRWNNSTYPMAGFLPVEISLGDRPEGHGYEEVLADRPNPFVPAGTILRGHEFHYSKITESGQVKTAFEVKRGVGTGKGRDGIAMNRVLASYLHVHSLASPDWAEWLVRAGLEYKQEKVLRITNDE